MKCKDIHAGFPDKNIRDMLSHMLAKDPPGDSQRIREEIKELEERLEIAERSEAALKLIVTQGWAHHDVSEDVSDYHKERYFPFVGTDEERDEVFE